MNAHDVLTAQIVSAQKVADKAPKGSACKTQALFALAAAHSAMAFHLIQEATALINGPRNPLD